MRAASWGDWSSLTCWSLPESFQTCLLTLVTIQVMQMGCAQSWWSRVSRGRRRSPGGRMSGRFLESPWSWSAGSERDSLEKSGWVSDRSWFLERVYRKSIILCIFLNTLSATDWLPSFSIILKRRLISLGTLDFGVNSPFKFNHLSVHFVHFVQPFCKDTSHVQSPVAQLSSCGFECVSASKPFARVFSAVYAEQFPPHSLNCRLVWAG